LHIVSIAMKFEGSVLFPFSGLVWGEEKVDVRGALRARWWGCQSGKTLGDGRAVEKDGALDEL